jgi:hypothetical protein
MGYRSDVVIAIEKEVYDAEILLGLGRDNWFHNAARLDKGAYYWVFEGTKWSDSYPECAYVTRLLDSIGCVDANDSKYAFVRAGEDGDDTEELGNPDAFNITLVTYQSAYIEYDFDTSPKIPTIGEQNAATAA